MTRSTYLARLCCSGTGETCANGGALTELLGLSAAGRPIVCEYDLATLRHEVDRERMLAPERNSLGIWRWRELLPLPLHAAPITLGEGNTPLLRAPTLEAELGLDRLWIKDESTNPTGSFKARGMSVAVTMAHHLGARALVVPSAGNAGGAMAAYGARAGLRCHVFVPADTPEVNRREVTLFGGELHVVEGLIDACGRQATARAESLHAFSLSTLKEPYRLEGKKTMGLELAAQLGWRVPDVIVYPTGGGTGLIGMHRAFDELAALGWIDGRARPRMVVVQASGCAPIVKAFADGRGEASPWSDAHTCASGLRVPSAVGDFLILDAIRSSRGTAIAVSDEELKDDMRALAAATGVCAAPEGGACLSAVRRLRASGWVAADEEVVLFNTGAGTKYLEVLRDG